MLSLCTPAWADTNDEEYLAMLYGDKSSVSIATGGERPVSHAPAVTTVITAEEIAAMGATDLDEILETVPGLHVNHNPSMNSTQYVIRGIYSLATPQVLMLQNGIPVTTLLAGGKGNLWGGMPPENIARIEVIRGPGSALYGADAFSGVINIITKTAPDIGGTQVGARLGSFGSRNAWILHGAETDALGVAAYLGIGTTDGFKKTVLADAQTRNDTLFHTQASLAPGQTNLGVESLDGGLDLSHDKWRWRTGYKLRDDMGSYIGLGSALDPVGRGKSERITSDISWTDENIGKDWGVALDVAFMRYKQRYATPALIFPPGATLPTGTFTDGMIGAPETSERQLRLSASATYSGFSRHSLRFGLGHDDLDMYDVREFKNFFYTASGVPVPNGPVVDALYPFLTPHRRLVNYLYAQDEWNLARDWTLTAGVRHDNYSDAGGTTNPRLALVWEMAYNVTAKLLYGSAFRAPAFSESYSVNNPISTGNADLVPEKNRTWEAALSWQTTPELLLGINAFHYEMSDIIRSVPNPAPVPGTTYQNTGSQHGDGLEIEATWDIRRNLRLSANYAYQQSIDEATGHDAGYAPHHHLYARADWRFSNDYVMDAQVNHVADRKRAFGDNRPALADYTTFDLTLRSARRKGHWNFALSARNLFNADVREPSLAPGLTLPYDLPLAPRSVYVQAGYTL